jgi:hypothetical protein
MMPKTKPLTKAELDWLKEVQSILNRCPSKRIAFFTVGDNFVGLHDETRELEIGEDLERNGGEWCSAASRVGADFGGKGLFFPNAVHSTAG